MSNDKRIIIMAGGTGGHVFPALAVALELRQRGWQVSWLGTQGGLEARVIPANGIDIDWLSVSGIRGKGLSSKFLAVTKLLKAALQARAVLRRRKPAIVLGMGGFVAGPGGLMAKWLSIPLIVHEQNRVPGTTNRWLAKLAADKVLQAFPGSFSEKVGAVCTGNPLRADFATQSQREVWQPQLGRKLRLLILGGSQGAKVLNDNVPQALASITQLEIRHQTGSAMQAEVQQRYQSLGIQAQVDAFIDDMAGCYLWADLIVCRAGAMTVSEVAASGLPAIFVPLQNAIDDHQTANARYLSEAGAALLLPQQELNSASLALKIEQAIPSLATMSRATLSLARPDATRDVADLCEAEAQA